MEAELEKAREVARHVPSSSFPLCDCRGGLFAKSRLSSEEHSFDGISVLIGPPLWCPMPGGGAAPTLRSPVSYANTGDNNACQDGKTRVEADEQISSCFTSGHIELNGCYAVTVRLTRKIFSQRYKHSLREHTRRDDHRESTINTTATEEEASQQCPLGQSSPPFYVCRGSTDPLWQCFPNGEVSCQVEVRFSMGYALGVADCQWTTCDAGGRHFPRFHNATPNMGMEDNNNNNKHADVGEESRTVGAALLGYMEGLEGTAMEDDVTEEGNTLLHLNAAATDRLLRRVTEARSLSMTSNKEEARKYYHCALSSASGGSVQNVANLSSASSFLLDFTQLLLLWSLVEVDSDMLVNFDTDEGNALPHHDYEFAHPLSDERQEEILPAALRGLDGVMAPIGSRTPPGRTQIIAPGGGAPPPAFTLPPAVHDPLCGSAVPLLHSLPSAGRLAAHPLQGFASTDDALGIAYSSPANSAYGLDHLEMEDTQATTSLGSGGSPRFPLHSSRLLGGVTRENSQDAETLGRPPPRPAAALFLPHGGVLRWWNKSCSTCKKITLRQASRSDSMQLTKNRAKDASAHGLSTPNDNIAYSDQRVPELCAGEEVPMKSSANNEVRIRHRCIPDQRLSQSMKSFARLVKHIEGALHSEQLCEKEKARKPQRSQRGHAGIFMSTNSFSEHQLLPSLLHPQLVFLHGISTSRHTDSSPGRSDRRRAKCSEEERRRIWGSTEDSVKEASLLWREHSSLYTGGSSANALQRTAKTCRRLHLREEEDMILLLARLSQGIGDAALPMSDEAPLEMSTDRHCGASQIAMRHLLSPVLEKTIDALISRGMPFLAGVVLCNILIPAVLHEMTSTLSPTGLADRGQCGLPVPPSPLLPSLSNWTAAYIAVAYVERILRLVVLVNIGIAGRGRRAGEGGATGTRQEGRNGAAEVGEARIARRALEEYLLPASVYPNWMDVGCRCPLRDSLTAPNASASASSGTWRMGRGTLMAARIDRINSRRGRSGTRSLASEGTVNLCMTAPRPPLTVCAVCCLSVEEDVEGVRKGRGEGWRPMAVFPPRTSSRPRKSYENGEISQEHMSSRKCANSVGKHHSGSIELHNVDEGCLVVQCTRCGHGGHVDHILDWWRESSSSTRCCPMGCRCICTY